LDDARARRSEPCGLHPPTTKTNIPWGMGPVKVESIGLDISLDLVTLKDFLDVSGCAPRARSGPTRLSQRSPARAYPAQPI